MSFNINVQSQASTPVSIAYFIKPSTITKSNHSTIYSDMFPVAWKVFDFPGQQASAYSNLNATEEVGEESNLVPTVGLTNQTGSTQLFGSVHSTSTTSIDPQACFMKINQQGEIESIATVGEENDQVQEFEFAAVIIPKDSIKVGEIFKGETDYPFISFNSKDVEEGNQVHLHFNGTSLKVTGLKKVRHHTSNQKPFLA